MSSRIHRLSVAALTAAAALTFGAFANAAFYSSNFDPPGPLSFFGTALFQIDDGCLVTDGTKTASSCNLTMLSASIDMTDTVSNDTGHLAFGSNTLDLFSLIISGGELVGVDSGLIGAVFAAPCTGTLCGFPFWMQWQTDPNSVLLYTGNCIEGCFPNANESGTAENVTFTRVFFPVPEPGTLGLLVAALGVGWLVRRRSTA